MSPSRLHGATRSSDWQMWLCTHHDGGDPAPHAPLHQGASIGRPDRSLSSRLCKSSATLPDNALDPAACGDYRSLVCACPQATQAGHTTTRRDVVERLANVDLHPPRPRRSNSTCTLPTGTAPQTFMSEGWTYYQDYSGSGYTEDPNNDGNQLPSYPPYTTDIGFFDIPDAIQRCKDIASADPPNYLSVDLHFLTSTCTWICVQYVNDNDMIAMDFDQPNADVAIGYGYSV